MTRHTVSVILLILLYVHMFSLKLKKSPLFNFYKQLIAQLQLLCHLCLEQPTRLASFAPEANDAETKLTRLDNRIGVIGRPLTMPAATNILNVATLFELLSITLHTQPQTPTPPVRRHESKPTQSVPPVATLLWEQQHLAIVGDAAQDYLGTLVALSVDAKTLVIGASGGCYYGNTL